MKKMIISLIGIIIASIILVIRSCTMVEVKTEFDAHMDGTTGKAYIDTDIETGDMVLRLITNSGKTHVCKNPGPYVGNVILCIDGPDIISYSLHFSDLEFDK